MTAPYGPLAETLERLAGVHPWFGGHLGEPEGDGWHRFSDVAHDDRLAAWVDGLAAQHDGRRDVAGSYLGGWLAGAARCSTCPSATTTPVTDAPSPPPRRETGHGTPTVLNVADPVGRRSQAEKLLGVFERRAEAVAARRAPGAPSASLTFSSHETGSLSYRGDAPFRYRSHPPPRRATSGS